MDQTRDDSLAHYRARSLKWSIQTDDLQVRALVDTVFADLEAPSSDEWNHIEIRRANEPGRFVLTRDGRETSHAAAHVFDHLIGFVNQGVRDQSTNTVDLHASALTDPVNGMTVVTAAPSGGGKTSIAAHLCRRGWAYLSDETVGVDVNDGSLIGCGKPLTIKPGLHATLGIDLGPLTIDPALQQRWYVRPALLGGSITATAPPPTDLVFIDFDAQADGTEIRDVPPHDALMRLLPNTFQLDRHGARVLPTLARLVARARVWEIQTGDGADAVDHLLAAADELAQPDRELLPQAAPRDAIARRGPAPAVGTVFAGFAGSGAVVHDHVRSEAVELDAIGAVVWQLLDGSADTTEIANALAEHFDVPASTIGKDVEVLCTDLVARGFLVPTGQPASSERP